MILDAPNFFKILDKKTFGPYTRNGVTRYRNYKRELKTKTAVSMFGKAYLEPYCSMPTYYEELFNLK